METMDSFISKAMHELKEKSKPPYEPTEDELLYEAKVLTHRCGYQPHDPEAFKGLCKWMARRRGRHNNKGLLLVGNAGCGKTFFASLCHTPMVTATKIVQVYKAMDGRMTNPFWYQVMGVYESESWTSHLVVDDLGQEPVVNMYGHNEEAMDVFICQRYKDWQSKGAITTFTSNKSVVELDARYGRRITDRIREMCDLVEFKGKSMRGI